MSETPEQFVQLDEDDYLAQFPKKKQKAALEVAWKNRDFEIELYWKRATYFWTFLVATFGGYFVIISEASDLSKFPQAELMVISLGFTFSFAWYLVNIGSKKWQENWEKHVDMLEDRVTGPLYKTVYNKSGYSVSGINMDISMYVMIVWFGLFLKYTYGLRWFFKESIAFNDWDLTSFMISAFTTIFCSILWFRQRRPSVENNKHSISFQKRNVRYEKL